MTPASVGLAPAPMPEAFVAGIVDLSGVLEGLFSSRSELFSGILDM